MDLVCGNMWLASVHAYNDGQQANSVGGTMDHPVSDFLSRHMSLGFLRLGRRGGVGGCGGRRPPTGKGLQVSFVTPQLAL